MNLGLFCPIVHTSSNSDHSDSGNLEPTVTIEKIKMERSDGFSSSDPYSEYQYPIDPKWEYDRSKLFIKGK